MDAWEQRNLKVKQNISLIGWRKEQLFEHEDDTIEYSVPYQAWTVSVSGNAQAMQNKSQSLLFYFITTLSMDELTLNTCDRGSLNKVQQLSHRF